MDNNSAPARSRPQVNPQFQQTPYTLPQPARSTHSYYPSLLQRASDEEATPPIGNRSPYDTSQNFGGPEQTLNEFLRESASTSNTGLGHNVVSGQVERAMEEYARRYASGGATTPNSALSSLPSRRKRGASNSEQFRRQRSSFAMSSNTSDANSGTASNPIDLTSPERPPYRPHYNNEQRQNSYTLPRWQPDADVSRCPVCGTVFSFWYRKHHCRKCGRVVCANCSPHRITIPRQYVVQPPPAASASPLAVLTGLSDANPVAPANRYLDNALGNGGAGLSPNNNWNAVSTPSGAEVVRVCNPCVPDPNLSPPPQLPLTSALPPLPVPGFNLQNQARAGGHSQNMVSPPIPHNYGSMVPPYRASSMNTANQVQPPYPRLAGSYSSPFSMDPTRAPPPPPPQLQRLPSRPHRASIAGPAYSAVRPGNTDPGASLPSGPTSLHRYRHSTSLAPPPPPPFHSRPGIVTGDQARRPGPANNVQQPRRQIAEEDECPVCGQELPPKGPNGEEQPRIQHVEFCIRQYSAPVVPAGDPVQPGSATSSASVPVVGAAAAGAQTNDRPAAASSFSESAPRRATGNRMLVYKANEKDCLGEDGEPQECVICFEEFEEGVEMGRLECLCKFHRACIRRWWETKGVGSCPTHQLHE